MASQDHKKDREPMDRKKQQFIGFQNEQKLCMRMLSFFMRIKTKFYQNVFK